MGHVLDTVGHIATGIGKAVKPFAHYVGDAAAVLTGNPELIPVIEGANSALGTYGRTHNLGDALKSGAIVGGATYAGTQLGGALGSRLGTVGSTAFNSLPSGAAGSFLGNMIPGELANVGLGSSLGGFAGNAIGSSLADSMFPKAVRSPMPQPFNASQVSLGKGLPAGTLQGGNLPNGTVSPSISAMSTLTDPQKSTNLATQGTYGGGLGPQEQKYFLNLENNRLVNPSGALNPLSTLSPIENSYLAKLGLGGYGNTQSLLKAMNQWKPA